MTHEQFKVMAALVDVTGVARRAGMSPGVYLKHMADMEVKAEMEKASPCTCSAPPCRLCGKSAWPGAKVVYEDGSRVFICRPCLRDPIALGRLEEDPDIVPQNSQTTNTGKRPCQTATT